MIRILVLAFCLSGAAGAQVLMLGTSAPKDTYWHITLLEMAQEWKRVSGGRVTASIFPGGVQGSEVEMIRKVRIDALQGVAISGASLPVVDRSVQCLSIPMMLESYEEFDYVFERVRPTLEERLARNGFVVLQWADAGWVYFFTKKPATTLAEIKSMRLFTSAGDAEAERLYTEFGFHPIPLASKDLNDNLLRGVVEAFDVPPLFALASQTFASAKNMVDVRWAPLVASTLISQKAWNRIPEDLRPKLLEIARKAEARVRGPIRKQEQEAVATMVKHGLNVVKVDATTLADWRTQTEAAWPRMVGRIVPEDLFLEVKRLRDEHRKAKRK